MSKPQVLCPFISYKGGKWKLASRYPKPEWSVIVEPFAGSAGYSCYHYRHRVILLDSYIKVAKIWAYLRRANRRQILDLPELLLPEANINETLPHLKQVERDLIGFWNDKGLPQPVYYPSKWSLKNPKDFHWAKARIRIANQLPHIKHWTSHHADYRSVADVTHHTLFIDPPYQHHGTKYPEGNGKINFDELRETVHRLHWSNQVIVCEGEGANWLPFSFFCKGGRSLHHHKTDRRGPDELIWYRPSRTRRPAVGCGIDVSSTAITARWLTNVLAPRENAA